MPSLLRAVEPPGPETADAAAKPSARTDAVTAAFTVIGKVGDTGAPPRTKSTDKLALEYWTASLLAKLAEARREQAKRAAIAGGVLPDTAADPLPVGSTQTVYAGALVTIGIKVVAQGDRVDVAGLVAGLLKAAVPETTVKRLLRKHTTTFPGANVFTARLTGE